MDESKGQAGGVLTPVAKWHELKTDPDVFDAVASGAKTCEIRYDDRDFQVGDGLLLRRTRDTGWAMKNTGAPLVYTGEECRRVVSHVLRGYGLEPGWVILSFRPTPAAAAEHPLWQKLRDLLGLDGWHDGHYHGVASPEQIVTHIEYVASERARLLHAELVAGVPTDMVMVPREFLQGFSTLAHNYSLNAEAPDYYHGVERDAFSNAYRRCGSDLAKLRDLLAASPVAPAGAPTEERECLREVMEADKAYNIAQSTDDGAARHAAIKRLSAAHARARALLSAGPMENDA